MNFKAFKVQIKSPSGVQTQWVETCPMKIGRSYSADLPLIDNDISRQHLTVYCENGTLFIEDLQSKNGTFVAGSRLPASQVISYQEGQPISLGKSNIELTIFVEFHQQAPQVQEVGSVRGEPSPSSTFEFTASKAIKTVKHELKGRGEGLFGGGDPESAAEKRARKIIAKAEAIASQLQQKTEKEADVLIKDAKKQANDLYLESKASFREAELAVETKLKEASLKSEEILNQVAAQLRQAQTEAEAQLKSSREKGQALMREAEERLSRMQHQGESELNEAKDKSRKMIADAEVQAREFEQKIREQAQKDFEETLRQARHQADRLRDETESYIQGRTEEITKRQKELEAFETEKRAELAQLESEVQASLDAQKKTFENYISELEQKKKDLSAEVLGLEQALPKLKSEREIWARGVAQSKFQQKTFEAEFKKQSEDAERFLEQLRLETIAQQQMFDQLISDQSQKIDQSKRALEQFDRELKALGLKQAEQRDLIEILDKTARQKEEVIDGLKADIDTLRERRQDVEHSIDLLEKKRASDLEQLDDFRSQVRDQLKLEREKQVLELEQMREKSLESIRIEEEASRAKADLDLQKAFNEIESFKKEEYLRHEGEKQQWMEAFELKKDQAMKAKEVEISDLQQNIDRLQVAHDDLSAELNSRQKQLEQEITALEDVLELKLKQIEEEAAVRRAALEQESVEAIANLSEQKKAIENKIESLELSFANNQQALEERSLERQKELEQKFKTFEQDLERQREQLQASYEKEVHNFEAILASEREKLSTKEDEAHRLRLEAVETEFRRRRVDLDQKLALLKTKRLEDADNEVRLKEEKFEFLVADRKKELTFQIQSYLLPRLKALLPKEETNERFDKIEQDIQNVVYRVIDQEPIESPEELIEVYQWKADEENRWLRKKNLKKHLMVAAAVLALVFGLGPFLLQSLKNEVVEMASTESSARDLYLAKFAEKKANKPKFEPKTELVYKDTYTDRVLYLTDYVANELEPEYREEWILKLNEFFVSQLKLSENVIVTFIAKESNLLRELASLKEGVNPQFEKEGVQALKDREQVFTATLKTELKTSQNFVKFKKFKQEFYSKRYLSSMQ